MLCSCLSCFFAFYIYAFCEVSFLDRRPFRQPMVVFAWSSGKTFKSVFFANCFSGGFKELAFSTLAFNPRVCQCVGECAHLLQRSLTSTVALALYV